MKGFVSSVVSVVVIAFLAAMFPQQALAAGAPPIASSSCTSTARREARHV